MPSPTNTTALTATDIGALPASISQNVHDAGTTYSVWYKWTATETQELSIFGYGSVTYTPFISVFVGPASAPVSYLVTGDASSVNKPAQVPVVEGTEYFFKFTTNAGNPSPAVLLLEAFLFTPVAAVAGDLVVNDDTEGFPAVIIGTDGTIKRFIQDFPAGEGGDVLANGRSAWHNQTDDTLGIYNADLSLRLQTVSGVNLSSLLGSLRTCQGTQRWWFTSDQGASCTAQYVTADGTLGDAHTITVASIACCAASNDETILYHARTSIDTALKRWDLVNDVALSDLAASIGAYKNADILVLEDGTIVASYVDNVDPVDLKVIRYNVIGSVLNTYEFGADFVFPSGTFPRLAYGRDSSSFWVWMHPNGADEGLSRFQEVRVSDGVILTDFTTVEYEAGIYQRDAAATPEAFFGNSYSCPFIVLGANVPVPPPPPPDEDFNGPDGLDNLEALGLIRHVDIRWLRRAPVLADENQRLFFGKFELDMAVGTINKLSGNGYRPVVLCRTSNDGGYTWFGPRTMGLGEQGAYGTRVYTMQNGSARKRVFEVYGSDPVQPVLLAAFLDVTEGSS